MTIAELLTLKPDASVTVLNKPFTLAGSVTVALDGDGTRAWLYEEDGGLLALSPEHDEILFFEAVDEELEPENGIILLRGKEYEFGYEDAGTATVVAGDVEPEEEDRYAFADYEDDEGAIVRLLTNENTGDVRAFHGRAVGEEDIQPVA